MFSIRQALLPVALFTAVTAVAIASQQPEQRALEAQKPEGYSPQGFAELLAYEQAYPLEIGHPVVRQAALLKYWLYRGRAYGAGASPLDNAWTSLGPVTSLQDPASGSTETVSGRVSALMISPDCTEASACRLWVGTAGGGVWRTDDAMNPDDVGWRWIGAGLGTNSIGSLAMDPNDRTGDTIFVGTGETNTPHNSGAGTGVYRSTDGGDHWTRLSTTVVDPVVSPTAIDFTFTRGVAAVVVEPGNSQTIWVATTTAMLGMTGVRGGQSQIIGRPQPRVGLYRTDNGGLTWSLVWVPPLEPLIAPNPNLGSYVGDTMAGVRDIKLDPRNAKIVYVSAFNNGIYRSAPSLENGDAAFKPVFGIVSLQRFRDLAMFDLTVKDGRTRIYAYNGTEALAPQSLYRADNADVPAASLATTGAGGAVSNTGAWLKLSTDDTSQAGSVSRRICSSQCFYDLVVAVPPDRPDTVILGGVQAPDLGEATIRSTDAGASFRGFGNDAQTPRNTSHVDVRSVVFHPRNPNIAFVGSDGGVVRNDGVFRDNSARCPELVGNAPQCRQALSEVPRRIYFLNRGLQTLQFYNVSIDPAAPLRRLIGGLQDNGTIWIDGTGAPGVWKSLFPFGDGTSASGFHPTRPDVMFASFQSNRFFTNFRNGALANWVRTDDPIRASGERATITASTGRQFITFDRVRPDTQFTAFQHVWRTQSNGGNQAALEASCRFPAQSGGSCGDWVPLGVTFPFVAGSTPASESRKPGDLTSDFYGTGRVGGIIVAAERAAGDAGTLWAATNFGRLFVTKNADGPAAAVTFARVDGPTLPNRFVTRIAVDRANPNVAYISYSGFSAVTPATPGHVFRAVFDPATGQATFTSFDLDLGDIPINTLAFDDATGDIYVGTDFGPLRLRRGATSWQAAGLGFPEALMVDLEIDVVRRVLVAATHGMGIFYLQLQQMGQ